MRALKLRGELGTADRAQQMQRRKRSTRRAMTGACFRDATKTTESISHGARRRLQVRFGERLQGHFREPLHAAELDRLRFAVVRGLDRRDKRLLARSTAATFAVVALATEVDVVHLDAAVERLLGLALHHALRQFVLDLPPHRPNQFWFPRMRASCQAVCRRAPSACRSESPMPGG